MTDVQDLKKQIEETKQQIEQQKLLNELTKLQAAITPTATAKANDPMQKMLKWAFPAGVVLGGLGIVMIMLFGQFVLGMTLGAMGAVCIAVKIGLDPSIKLPSFLGRFNPPTPPPAPPLIA